MPAQLTLINHASDSDNGLSNNVAAEISVTARIASWAVNEVRVPKASVSRLLVVLHPVMPDLPLSQKSLLPKPVFSHRRIGDGQYIHLQSWLDTLKNILLHYYGQQTGTVTYYLTINIDGLPLFKHSPDFKLYPILVTVYKLKMRPICVGIYSSDKSLDREMPDPAVYLKDFFNDMQNLRSNPMTVYSVTFELKSAGIFI